MMIIHAIAALALSVCSAAPDWLDGSSGAYPRETYLIGVGVADDKPSATDRARGEIARVFSTVVTVQTSVSETESNQTAAGKQASTFSQSVSNNVQTATRKVLEGVEIAETYEDQKGRRHYALAVLDRQKGSAALTDKIQDFDRQAAQWKTQMEGSGDRLGRVKCALKVLALLKAREELNAELRVLSPGGKGLAAAFDESVLRPKASKAVSELEVSVNAVGDQSQAVETGIVKGLNSLGFEARAIAGTRSTQDALPADIQVDATVDADPLEPKGGWKWARATATVSLKDGRTGKIFLRFDASHRQAAADQKEAMTRSLASLSKKVAAQTNAAITSYFENQ